jgi:hypothetical protein
MKRPQIDSGPPVFLQEIYLERVENRQGGSDYPMNAPKRPARNRKEQET